MTVYTSISNGVFIDDVDGLSEAIGSRVGGAGQYLEDAEEWLFAFWAAFNGIVIPFDEEGGYVLWNKVNNELDNRNIIRVHLVRYGEDDDGPDYIIAAKSYHMQDAHVEDFDPDSIHLSDDELRLFSRFVKELGITEEPRIRITNLHSW
jgi:hypothetical protein